mmetsp:Transcript_35827/g.94880  ORF Transcript_35827/g.94880 Transcript_35827/m.94880 type:complete len:248 (-) Transcript_35827:364-1107(-)
MLHQRPRRCSTSRPSIRVDADVTDLQHSATAHPAAGQHREHREYADREHVGGRGRDWAARVQHVVPCLRDERTDPAKDAHPEVIREGHARHANARREQLDCPQVDRGGERDEDTENHLAEIHGQHGVGAGDVRPPVKERQRGDHAPRGQREQVDAPGAPDVHEQPDHGGQDRGKEVHDQLGEGHRRGRQAVVGLDELHAVDRRHVPEGPAAGSAQGADQELRPIVEEQLPQRSRLAWALHGSRVSLL